MGICDTQVCREGDYECMGDQLQVCNADFTGYENEGPACEPGLCSKEAKACLECMPMSPATCEDERTIMTCSAEGMLTPMPCAMPTPFCAEGACVQCNTDADSGEPMNECGTLTCNAGMCAAGSPKPKGTACSSNGGKMCDFLGSCVTCVTDLDCNDSTKRCYLQQRCVPKDAVVATPLLSSYSVTVSPGFRARVTVSPATANVSGVPGTNTLEGSQAFDATFLLSVPNYSAASFLPVIASQAGSTASLTFRPPSDMTMCQGDCSNITVTLRAEEI